MARQLGALTSDINLICKNFWGVFTARILYKVGTLKRELHNIYITSWMTKSNLLTGPIDFCYKLLWTVLNINLKIINEFYCVAVFNSNQVKLHLVFVHFCAFILDFCFCHLGNRFLLQFCFDFGSKTLRFLVKGKLKIVINNLRRPDNERVKENQLSNCNRMGIVGVEKEPFKRC